MSSVTINKYLERGTRSRAYVLRGGPKSSVTVGSTMGTRRAARGVGVPTYTHTPTPPLPRPTPCTPPTDPSSFSIQFSIVPRPYSTSRPKSTPKLLKMDSDVVCLFPSSWSVRRNLPRLGSRPHDKVGRCTDGGRGWGTGVVQFPFLRSGSLEGPDGPLSRKGTTRDGL